MKDEEQVGISSGWIMVHSHACLFIYLVKLFNVSLLRTARWAGIHFSTSPLSATNLLSSVFLRAWLHTGSWSYCPYFITRCLQTAALCKTDKVWKDVWSGNQEIPAWRPAKFTEVFRKFSQAHVRSLLYNKTRSLPSLPSHYIVHIHKPFDTKRRMQLIKRR
jgi:hypothetical protein